VLSMRKLARRKACQQKGGGGKMGITKKMTTTRLPSQKMQLLLGGGLRAFAALLNGGPVREREGRSNGTQQGERLSRKRLAAGRGDQKPRKEQACFGFSTSLRMIKFGGEGTWIILEDFRIKGGRLLTGGIAQKADRSLWRRLLLQPRGTENMTHASALQRGGRKSLGSGR